MDIRYHQEMMKMRIVVVLLVVGVIGWLGLLLMQRQLGVGRFAESPQQVRLEPGRRAVVGGGRAVLGFVSESRDVITVEVRCAAATRRIQLGRGSEGRKAGGDSEAICGVEVRWLQDAAAPGENAAARTFAVSWVE